MLSVRDAAIWKSKSFYGWQPASSSLPRGRRTGHKVNYLFFKLFYLFSILLYLLVIIIKLYLLLIMQQLWLLFSFASDVLCKTGHTLLHQSITSTSLSPAYVQPQLWLSSCDFSAFSSYSFLITSKFTVNTERFHYIIRCFDQMALKDTISWLGYSELLVYISRLVTFRC